MANSTKNKQQGEMMRFMFGESKEKKWVGFCFLKTKQCVFAAQHVVNLFCFIKDHDDLNGWSYFTGLLCISINQRLVSNK